MTKEYPTSQRPCGGFVSATQIDLMRDALLIYWNGKRLRPVEVPSIYTIPDSVRERYLDMGIYLFQERSNDEPLMA